MPVHPAAARRPGHRRPVRGDRAPGHRRPPPVRLVRDERRGVRPGGRVGSAGRRAQDDRVPDERRLGDRTVADEGFRERQAGRLRRRAEGALRRASQHRLGARPGAGGRACRLRVPGHEDPREDDAGRSARGRRAAALRAHRHRQLPRDDRADLRGRRASSPPTPTSARTSPTCSTSSPASAGRSASASCSSRRSISGRSSSSGSRTSRTRLPQASTRASGSSATASPTRR